jgi:hypothetical protein
MRPSFSPRRHERYDGSMTGPLTRLILHRRDAKTFEGIEESVDPEGHAGC